MQNIILQKNADPKNQIILFLFCRPTDPIYLLSLPVDQKMNLVLPYRVCEVSEVLALYLLRSIVSLLL